MPKVPFANLDAQAWLVPRRWADYLQRTPRGRTTRQGTPRAYELGWKGCFTKLRPQVCLLLLASRRGLGLTILRKAIRELVSNRLNDPRSLLNLLINQELHVSAARHGHPMVIADCQPVPTQDLTHLPMRVRHANRHGHLALCGESFPGPAAPRIGYVDKTS